MDEALGADKILLSSPNATSLSPMTPTILSANRLGRSLGLHATRQGPSGTHRYRTPKSKPKKQPASARHGSSHEMDAAAISCVAATHATQISYIDWRATFTYAVAPPKNSISAPP